MMATSGGNLRVLSFAFDDDERTRAFSINVAPSVHATGQTRPVLCRTGIKRCATFVGGRLLPLRTR